MRPFVYLLLLLTAIPGVASAAHAADDAGAKIQAREQYQHDLVTVLALRSDARPLLGAALLARPLHKVGGPLDFHHLIGRAAQAADAGPAVNWVRLSDCVPAADTCPNADALDALRRQAPDNAAVWMLLMGRDATDDDSARADRDFAHAAAAGHYDDYTGRSLQALAEAIGELPPPDAALAGDGSRAARVGALRMALVYGIGDAQPLPGFPIVAARCAAQAVGKDEHRRQTCLALANVLEWGSSPLSRSLGLHLASTLATTADQRNNARSDMRDLVWQVHAFGELGVRARSDPGIAGLLLRLARQGGTEMSLMRAALRASGVPLTAPDGWQPQDAAHGDAAPSAKE